MRQRQVSGVSVTESFRLHVQRKDGLRDRWYNTDPAFKERVDEITETQVDFRLDLIRHYLLRTQK